MILNGEISTPAVGNIYAVPTQTPGIPLSGNPVEVNFFRIVNESLVTITFTIYLNVNGTDRAITPVSRQLIAGAAYDDIPVIQLPPGALICGVASGADVSWSINAVALPAQ